MTSPYQIFNSWLFDGSIDTPLPKPHDGIDLLKYSSPITHTFVLQMFMRHARLNKYLDEYFNNIGLRYLPKDELFLFIKKCIIDFRVLKRDTVFYPYRQKNKLFDALRNKLPELKNNDLTLLCDIIEKMDNKDSIYETLGLEKPPKKQKIKISKNKEVSSEKISLKELLEKHFSTIET